MWFLNRFSLIRLALWYLRKKTSLRHQNFANALSLLGYMFVLLTLPTNPWTSLLGAAFLQLRKHLPRAGQPTNRLPPKPFGISSCLVRPTNNISKLKPEKLKNHKQSTNYKQKHGPRSQSQRLCFMILIDNLLRTASASLLHAPSMHHPSLITKALVIFDGVTLFCHLPLEIHHFHLDQVQFKLAGQVIFEENVQFSSLGKCLRSWSSKTDDFISHALISYLMLWGYETPLILWILLGFF